MRSWRGTQTPYSGLRLVIVLGVVLLAAGLGPRGPQEVSWGGFPEKSPQEARVAQPAPEGSSGQPASTETVTAPTETVPTDIGSVPIPREDYSAQPALGDSSGQPAPQDSSAQPRPYRAQ